MTYGSILLLAVDPKDYNDNANIILNLTFKKQDQYEAYKKAYRVTLELKHKDPPAQQGIVALYRKQGAGADNT